MFRGLFRGQLSATLKRSAVSPSCITESLTLWLKGQELSTVQCRVPIIIIIIIKTQPNPTAAAAS